MMKTILLALSMFAGVAMAELIDPNLDGVYESGKVITTADFCLDEATVLTIAAAHEHYGEEAGYNAWTMAVQAGRCYVVGDPQTFRLQRQVISFIDLRGMKKIEFWTGQFVGEGMSEKTYYVGLWTSLTI